MVILSFFHQPHWCHQQRHWCAVAAVRQSLLHCLVSQNQTASVCPEGPYWHRHLHYSYDEEADKVNQYQRLNLEGLEKIEIGKKLKVV